MKLDYKNITENYIIDAFYLSDRQDEHVIDDVISGWTGIFPCNYGTISASHEERMVFVDGVLWSFSATSRKELGNKTTGTRWIRASGLLRNAERWALRISPRLSTTEIEREIRRANSLIGMEYDFTGVVLDFVRPGMLFNNRKKIYCSKSCHYMHTGQMKRISPRRRSKYVKKHGYNVISVSDAFAMET